MALLCVSGPDQGKQIPLTDQIVTLGTSLQCGLLSDDPDATPEHADFIFKDGYVYFRSHAGAPLFLNGVAQAEGAMPPGGLLRVGRSSWQVVPLQTAAGAGPRVAVAQNGAWFEALNQRVGAVTGVGPVEGLDAREMFSSVFQKRTEEDVEDFLMAGARATTPPLDAVQAIWPKPWLFFKIFTLALLTYAGFFVGVEQFGNGNCLPGLIIVGSFAIPLTVVVFYYEMNVTRNVSFYQIFRGLLVGGILSLIVSLFGYGLIGSSLPGVVEELGKAAALLLFVNRTKYRWTLNGLLLGGAIGAGFAGFESAGYALRSLVHEGADGVVQSIFLRGVLSPGGHVAWAALEGAALWKVKGDRPFRYDMLQDGRFLRILGLCMVLHTLWDINLIMRLPLLVYFALLAGLFLVAWLAILSFIQDGLKQVQAAQAERAKGGDTPVEALS